MWLDHAEQLFVGVRNLEERSGMDTLRKYQVSQFELMPARLAHWNLDVCDPQRHSARLRRSVGLLRRAATWPEFLRAGQIARLSPIQERLVVLICRCSAELIVSIHAFGARNRNADEGARPNSKSRLTVRRCRLNGRWSMLLARRGHRGFRRLPSTQDAISCSRRTRLGSRANGLAVRSTWT
jgi:hypothetical protein